MYTVSTWLWQGWFTRQRLPRLIRPWKSFWKWRDFKLQCNLCHTQPILIFSKCPLEVFSCFSLQGSSDPSHFIFEINVGKGRIRHRTTLIFEWWISRSTTNRLRMTSFKFKVVLYWMRLFPTLIWMWTTLKTRRRPGS